MEKCPSGHHNKDGEDCSRRPRGTRISEGGFFLYFYDYVVKHGGYLRILCARTSVARHLEVPTTASARVACLCSE